MLSAQLTNMGESAAYVAHEVNQPLAAIVLSAEIALEWLTREPPNLDLAKQAIERVIGNSHRAADVARSARDQVRRSPIDITDVDIHNVIECVLDASSLDVHRLGIVVETQFAPGLGGVRGDRVQLERLTGNLIANAIDAVSTVDDRPRRLRISTGIDADGDMSVAVEDSGTGIDAAKLERIFDPFFTTKADGLGLGLPICRSIVESHGGRLWATANPVHGSTFRFTLPRQSR